VAGFWTLAALGAGLAGLFVGVLVLRTGILDFTLPAVERASSNHGNTLFQPRVLRALFPYLLLVVIIIVGQTVLKEPLGFLELNLQFPEVQTSFGWVTPEGPGRSIDLFGHAGALLLYGSVLGFLWFKWRGHLQTSTPYRARTIVRKTVKGSVKSTVSILVLVAMAVTMEHAGMTQLLAEALSRTGSLFPFLSPFVGALGAFMTGSNTNSNVVFGQLQLQTATALDLSVAVILAAQTAGGAIGSTFAPAKVVVGCSTVAGAQDGVVLRLATALGLSIVAILGIIALLFA
jgi:lactate permease